MIPTTIEAKYADLLTHYCLQPNPGDHVYIQTTILAEPLVRELYRALLNAGALPEFQLEISEQQSIYFSEADEAQLGTPSPLRELIFSDYQHYLYIKAPYNLRSDQSIDPARRTIRARANQHISEAYSRRTADGSMVRSLCLYPTQASAQEAGMSLTDYQSFVYKACYLDREDPIAAWLAVRDKQQHIVDYLNQCSSITYKNEHSDITFSTKGRTWINSDGRTNMPSGEVFTGPIEDSVHGTMYFDYPAIYRGVEVRGVRVEVSDGQVIKWSAETGQEILDEIMKLEGARVFGEAAIGTNDNIRRMTKNILFDEKMGGTVHMALGQSYLQTGGKNQSEIHWDLIADMTSGQIYADDQLIYENGRFLISA